jgi:hypothetical protein
LSGGTARAMTRTLRPCVPTALEGQLFDEYNVEGKKPSTSASIDMYTTKTSSRRFVAALMAKCPIFGSSEVETRSNTIGKLSRKLTTIATLDVAIKPFSKRLKELEANKHQYADLVEFFCTFYSEWASHFPAFLPTASGNTRTHLRKTSFALSNIMFFPMFRLAFQLWDRYTANNDDWRAETDWRDGLARLAGNVTVEVKGPDGKLVKTDVPVMARDSVDPYQVGNPAWRDIILVQQFNAKGESIGWSLSSTRQTRDAAYHYLIRVSGLPLASRQAVTAGAP